MGTCTSPAMAVEFQFQTTEKWKPISQKCRTGASTVRLRENPATTAMTATRAATADTVSPR